MIEPDADVVLVCQRVADLPTPPVVSRKALCASCGGRVWVALSSPAAGRLWCVSCARDEMDDASIEAPTEAQLADISAYHKRRAS